jgi:hypothetical protein
MVGKYWPLVRCASEFPFYPGGISIIHALLKEDFGQIIEVECGYLHSSDINPQKLINLKRITEFNGEYGCMGDLGMHVLHIPLRFGWFPHRVHAQLAKIVKERPDGKGKMVPCGTWDNATIFGEVEVASKGERFPITLHTNGLRLAKPTPGSYAFSGWGDPWRSRPNIPKLCKWWNTNRAVFKRGNKLT